MLLSRGVSRLQYPRAQHSFLPLLPILCPSLAPQLLPHPHAPRPPSCGLFGSSSPTFSPPWHSSMATSLQPGHALNVNSGARLSFQLHCKHCRRVLWSSGSAHHRDPPSSYPLYGGPIAMGWALHGKWTSVTSNRLQTHPQQGGDRIAGSRHHDHSPEPLWGPWCVCPIRLVTSAGALCLCLSGAAVQLQSGRLHIWLTAAPCMTARTV